MPSPETSRANLVSARNPWTDRSREESVLIWRLTLKWWIGGRDGRRNPKTQREWAEQLGVSQPYVAKMVRGLKRDWLNMAGRWRDEPKAKLEDLRRPAESRKFAEPQSVGVPHSQPQQPTSASNSAAKLSHHDDPILAHIGYNPNRTKSWF